MLRLALLLVALASLTTSGCALCWPRGGSMAQCGGEDDDDDSGTGDDDDDDPVDCLARRLRPPAFDSVDAFGYGTITSDTTDLPFCWFGEDVITQTTVTMSSAGATHANERIEWDVVFYGAVAETVVIDVNGTLNFEYQSSHNPNNGCDFNTSWDSPAVAVFWDNLNMTDDGAGPIRYDVVGPVGDRIAVAWWDGVFHDAFPGEPLSFQVHLFEADHHIEAHYLRIEHSEWDVDFGRSATVGLRHAQATLFSCNANALHDDLSIAWWPPE